MTDSAVTYDRDADGIVTLTLDDPQSSANTMNERYKASMHAAVERLVAEKDDVRGVVVASAKKTFFAGGDLKGMVTTTAADAERVFHEVEQVKADLRRLETLGKPVVAAINGAALGGGLEIALACHHRIAVDGRYEIGLPEATLGLLPGGGGVTRTVRMFGIQTALMDLLLQGPRMKPAAAKDKGLVDELVPSQEELLPAARAWVLAHADDEAGQVGQPWDREGYRLPGGTPSTPKLAAFLPAFPAMLRKQVKGADYPAQRAIMAAAIEGAQVDFETATRIESRYLAELITGSNSKNMIQAFFFDLSAINGGSLRPAGVPRFAPTKVGVLGAGMMGAGIAYSCARAGMQVVLKDVAQESADKGKAYSDKILSKAVERGSMTEAAKAEVLDRITATTEASDFAGVDLVIEAVFEDPALKARVYAEIQDVVQPDALLCSNTSTLPITGLADAVSRPADFIGLHFFSPVDKMPLVEIIKGDQTSDESVARALDVVQAIRKTPIVVNDSRGFYTSRVIGTMVNEGLAMLGEGVHPSSVERAATQAGYPVGTLQLSDELNMELMAKIAKATAEAEGDAFTPHPASTVIETMLAEGRSGRLRGAGFYDYDESGRRTTLWPGLKDLFPPQDDPADLDDLKDRYLFIEALETAKCFEEGVIESAAAANIGSIMGIGYPPLTGGTVQFMQGYDGATGQGLRGFVERADQLAKLHGDRFAPTDRLREMAEKGETFPA
ncbi:short chain enoyl-CoA hydratase /3-hydroxyacyl-CoA dehydrogenase [Nocardioides scoriae]|uniref:Short chain enoyl-CoA hydratase /3-hydroxyacyl-CoA dehydrogenase n=1 Tax=Nocardioides scoriae TaxID=642780 RepID=A0A1H1W1N2_9ACTN|nr:3-hydroxyacyl-CoA dehydrogenase NAD-binding domain-containing protein [Nocardioides scoriae]SDS91017.1 short chain enoyl-CoA hydratase /3-hydroxyacyl-CoA dehydrogenase [Nocardioides scoriae]